MYIVYNIYVEGVNLRILRDRERVREWQRERERERERETDRQTDRETETVAEWNEREEMEERVRDGDNNNSSSVYDV